MPQLCLGGIYNGQWEGMVYSLGWKGEIGPRLSPIPTPTFWRWALTHLEPWRLPNQIHFCQESGWEALMSLVMNSFQI